MREVLSNVFDPKEICARSPEWPLHLLRYSHLIFNKCSHFYVEIISHFPIGWIQCRWWIWFKPWLAPQALPGHTQRTHIQSHRIFSTHSFYAVGIFRLIISIQFQKKLTVLFHHLTWTELNAAFGIRILQTFLLKNYELSEKRVVDYS